MKNNKDDKCFQYALTVALNYEQIEKDLQRISKIKPFIDQYNWKEIDFLSHSINIPLAFCMCHLILKK